MRRQGYVCPHAACQEGRSVLWGGAAGIPQQSLMFFVLVSPEGWICLTKPCDAPVAAQAPPSCPFCGAAAETFCRMQNVSDWPLLGAYKDFCIRVCHRLFPLPLLLLPVWIMFVIHLIAVAMSGPSDFPKWDTWKRQVLSSWCFQRRVYDNVNKYAGASEAAHGDGSALPRAQVAPAQGSDEDSVRL